MIDTIVRTILYNNVDFVISFRFRNKVARIRDGFSPDSRYSSLIYNLNGIRENYREFLLTKLWLRGMIVYFFTVDFKRENDGEANGMHQCWIPFVPPFDTLISASTRCLSILQSRNVYRNLSNLSEARWYSSSNSLQSSLQIHFDKETNEFS